MRSNHSLSPEFIPFEPSAFGPPTASDAVVSSPAPACQGALVPSLPSVEVAAWIGCLFFLVAGWNQVEKFFDRRTRRGAPREIQPQPLAVSQFDPPVTETLCRSRHRELNAETQRLEQGLEAVRQERHCDVADLQQKIAKVDREVGELRACLELNNQQLTRIDSKLDRVIERHSP